MSASLQPWTISSINPIIPITQNNPSFLINRNKHVGISRMIKHSTRQKMVGIVVLLHPQNSALNARLTNVCGLTMMPRHLPIFVIIGGME